MTENLKRIKFYTDTHIAKAVAVQLRHRGVDVVRCEEVGMAEASDEEHLAYATRGRRAIITSDSDFLRLHEEWNRLNQKHAGIMYCQPHLQGKDGIGTIVKETMIYYELILSGAGRVEDDIDNHVFYIS